MYVVYTARPFTTFKEQKSWVHALLNMINRVQIEHNAVRCSWKQKPSIQSLLRVYESQKKNFESQAPVIQMTPRTKRCGKKAFAWTELKCVHHRRLRVAVKWKHSWCTVIFLPALIHHFIIITTALWHVIQLWCCTQFIKKGTFLHFYFCKIQERTQTWLTKSKMYPLLPQTVATELLSGNLCKSGPLHFGSEIQFPSNFAHETILDQK